MFHFEFFTEIDHVAIAVESVDAAARVYVETFGATIVHREVVESDGVEEVMLAVADSYIQLLQPTRDDSTVARFLARRGEGLHHVAYRVNSCEEALRAAKQTGIELLDQSPRAGGGGTLVAFIHPKHMSGVLVELVERRRH